MSRSWTPEEVHKASEIMKAAGYIGYEEFCADLDEKMPKAVLERFARGRRNTSSPVPVAADGP